MQLGQGGYWRWWMLAGALLLAILPTPARGGPPDVARLDELVWLADDIVEGHLVSDEQIEVTAVHAGALSAGQKISITNLRNYEKAWYSQPRNQIEPTDRLLLFVVRTRVARGPGASGWRDAYTIIPAGLHLIVRGRVAAFDVFSSNRYLIYSAENAVPAGDYRRALGESVARVIDLRKRFAAPVVPEDAGWLMGIARQFRPQAWTFPDDNSLAAATVARLLQLHNPALLDQAIDASPSMFVLLTPGFANAAGREHLLTTLADLTITESRRSRLTRLWSGVGVDFEMLAAQKADDGAASIRVRNMSRIAKAANTDGMPVDTVVKLIESIELAVTVMTDHDAPVRGDLAATGDLLRELYLRPTTNNATRYAIERIMLLIGIDAYDSLKPRGGPILAGVVQPTWVRSTTPTVVYEILPVKPFSFTAAELVVEPIGSAVQVTPLSSVMYDGLVKWAKLAQSQGARLGRTVWDERLPPNLPAGDYRAFIRLKNGEEIVSEWPTEGITNSPPIVAGASAPPPRDPTPLLPPGWLEAVEHWLPQAVVGAFILLLIRHVVKSRRRVQQFRATKCLSCGYDLRATADRCPECGAAPPPALRIRVLRRRLCYGCSGLLAIVVVASLFIWMRSYWISDCVINTNGTNPQAIYSTRGTIVIEQPCIGSALGWTYERDNPADMVRTPADSGSKADWNILGAQRAASIGITVIPLWQIALVASLASYGFWRLSRAIRATMPSPVKAAGTPV